MNNEDSKATEAASERGSAELDDGLGGFPRVTVRFEISIDDAPPAKYVCVTDRGLLDVCPIPMSRSENYSRFMLREVADCFQDAMKDALKLAEMDDA